jgi:hypothetical protein
MSTEDRFGAAIHRLFADPEPVLIQLSKQDLWCLICQVHLAIRHPQNVGPSKDIALRVCKDLVEHLAASEPDLRLLWAMGSVPQYDEPFNQ